MPATVRELIADASRRLQPVSDTPLLDAQILLANALGRDRGWLYAWPEHCPEPTAVIEFDRRVDARAAGTPIAYLTGSREFWSLSLAVSEATLIPRPETERLVEIALTLDLPGDARVLDLGTGSGAIAVALATERRDWKVTAVDRSQAALAVARTNAQRHAVEVRFIHSDWFAGLRSDERFDLIVGNPPYIAADDPHLSRGDVRFEPRSALAAGDDGLTDLRTIIDAAPGYLSPGGWLWLEHGLDQSKAVRSMLHARDFEHVASHTDLADLPRVSGGRIHP
jgi:release factor glutamine methyltransferase